MKGLVINTYWLGALITYIACIFFLNSLDVIVTMIGWFIIPQVFKFKVNEEIKDSNDMDN
jgi:hypothetical protein